MESTAAILLRRTRFSETSLIVTWLTREHGKLKTMARGALRPKSPYAGVLDLFFETEIGFSRSARSEIHTLKEVLLRSPFEGLRHDYGRVELAAYFVELIDQFTEPDHPVPELFDLLQRALVYLETAVMELQTRQKALLHFENELARLLGVHAEGSAFAALGRLMSLPPRLLETRRGLLGKSAGDAGRSC
jgi:DNA repair protein RecO (recombination protein O)